MGEVYTELGGPPTHSWLKRAQILYKTTALKHRGRGEQLLHTSEYLAASPLRGVPLFPRQTAEKKDRTEA